MLPAWKGFRYRRRRRSSGSVEIHIDAADEQSSPLREQIAAYRFLKTNDSKIATTVLKRVFGEYPKMRAMALQDYDYDPEIAKDIPEITELNDLKKLVRLTRVFIHRTVKSGVAHVGFSMNCTWESEHGLGVMTHKNSIVEIGHADISHHGGIAAQDAEE